jgi:hypothetical protein
MNQEAQARLAQIRDQLGIAAPAEAAPTPEPTPAPQESPPSTP